MTTKMGVWKNIKNLDIELPMKNELFKMLDEYFDRVEFVTDHVGVRDFMFIAEKGTRFTSNFFVAINVECEKSCSYKDNLIFFLNKYMDNSINALKSLVELFEETDRTLYIGIGFKESDKIEEEELVEKLLTGKYSTQEEILKEIRKFPEWYVEYAKNPNELKFITVKAEKYIKDVLKPLENVALQSHLNEILEKDDLTGEDKTILKTLASHLAN